MYSRLPIPFPDSATYLWPLQDFDSGIWPSFHLRTPGYSLFWWACRLVSNDVYFVVCMQNALAVGTALRTLILLRRHAPRLVVPTAVTFAIFLSGNAHLTWDMSLLSDGPFTTTMVAWSLFTYLTLKTGALRFATAASLCAAAGIYLRPSSVYLVPIVAATSAYALWRGRGWRLAVALVAPLGVALLVLTIYNAVTIHVVGLSAGGSWARMWSTTVYLDPDSRLPPEINWQLADKNAALAPDDKRAIYEASDMRVFRAALEKNVGAGIDRIADRVMGWPGRRPERYMEYRSLMDRIVRTAIAQHPRLFLKNAVGTLEDYFAAIRLPQRNFYVLFPATTTYYEAFVQRPFYVLNLDGYYAPRRPMGFHTEVLDNSQRRVVTAPHRLNAWYARFSRVRSVLFENSFWIWPLPVALGFALWRVWATKGASVEAVTTVALLLAVIGNASACAYIGHLEYRYAEPFHFLNYLLVAAAVATIQRQFFGPGVASTRKGSS